MQNEEAKNIFLRSEIGRLRCENIAIQNVLKQMICPSCGLSAEEESKQSLQKLRQENLELRQQLLQLQRISNLLANYKCKPIQGSAHNVPNASSAGEGSRGPALEVDSLMGSTNADKFTLPNQMGTKSEITMIAVNAMHELIKLLRVDQPLWIKPATDDHYMLDRDSYEKKISQSRVPRFLKSRVESSKGTGVVHMDAIQLVDLYLDNDEWVHLCPTAVSRVRTIQVLEAGVLETRSGSLQLVHEQMHILSPLMDPLEFYVLRYCRQIEAGIWVILDVSYDFQDSSHISHSSCWKHPSGCMIQHIPNGLSKITFIEHVEVDERFQIHPVYEDLVRSVFKFGAKIWSLTLQRTCERNFYLSENARIGREFGGGRRSMTMLAFRMISSYCSIFSSSGNAESHQASELTQNGTYIALRKSTGPGQPIGMVILAASSFWVPASPQRVSKYLSDHKMRFQWDVLCYGCQVCEIVRTPTGRNSANHLSILQAMNPGEIMIFQETISESSGSLIVYAPIHSSVVTQLAMGMDSTTVPILASGFAISSDGPSQSATLAPTTDSPWSGGSFVTLGFQFLACSSLSEDDVSVDTVPTIAAFVARTVRLIKAAFGC